MLRKILLGLAALMISLLIFASFQPNEFRISRSVTISAAPESVFPHINDLKKSNAWSPWLKLDPNAKTTYEGPSSGVGAKSTWDGNEDIGKGSMTITESAPAKYVKARLDFLEPFVGTADTDYVLESKSPKETTLTWSMSGKNNFMSKIICVFMNQDKMIGGTFEKGLADLKSLLESNAR